MTKTPNATFQPNYPDQIISNKPRPSAEHAGITAPISADLRGMPGLSEQGAGLLEQAASMLEGLHNDERNRGNCSTAEGAACSADAVRRLAVQLLRAAQPAPAAAVPVLYVSPEQLAKHSDLDGAENTEAGRYLPARKTLAGKFTQPLYALAAAPAQAVAVPWDNFPAYLIDHCEGDTITEEEHVRAVLAAPQNWEGYEVRYLYAEAPPPLLPLTEEFIRQLDGATKFHESHNWSVRFARAIETAHGIKEPTHGQQT